MVKTAVWGFLDPRADAPAAGDEHLRVRGWRRAGLTAGVGLAGTLAGAAARAAPEGAGAAAVVGAAALVAAAATFLTLRRADRLGDAARAIAAGREAGLLPRGRWGGLAPVAPGLDAVATELAHRPARAAAAGVRQSPDLTVVIDPGGLVTEATAAAHHLLGRPPAWLVGRPLAALVHGDDRDRLAELRARPGGVRARVSAELRLSHLLGHWVDTEATAVDLTGDRHVGGVVLTIRDVSDRKAHEKDLLDRALHDPLTGLANRARFREHVGHALARSRRSTARPHTVLFIDLDGFKTVNDSLGHAAGDEVLREVGSRLRRFMRPGDTPARMGGDEFAVLLENTSVEEAGTLARRILGILLVPIQVQGKETVLTGSIGVAVSEPGQDAEELLRNADVAMYTAKAAGKGQYKVFEAEMHRAALRRLTLEADLRQAIDHDQLVLNYQPILSLATRSVVGVEVLVRWQHPTRGLIPPLQFISVAEDSGLIRPMGRWILEQACLQARTWHERYPALAGLRLCVNASVRQIEHPGFYDEVAEILERTGLDPHCLTLEITESLFMNDLAATVEKLRRLKGLGLRLAVDDFGTGYSSLSYLRSLPIDVLKIDKSFVHGVTLGPEQSAVARAIVKLARTFGLETVAEGVEDDDERVELTALGADMGQGFLFSRPLDAAAAEAYLAAGAPRHAVARAS